MMGYAVEDSKVRVDRFKTSGKWYDSWQIDMAEHYRATSLHDAVRECCLAAGMNTEGYTLVCLEPYHQHSHPVMLRG